MNRSDQNRALRDLDSLVYIVNELGVTGREILLRGRFSSGQRLRRKGELAEMEGTPGPHYNDPTGDDAVWSEEVRDVTGKVISDMATAMHQWLVMATWLRKLAGTDVRVRAEQTIPDCLACGKQCLEG